MNENINIHIGTNPNGSTVATQYKWLQLGSGVGVAVQTIHPNRSVAAAAGLLIHSVRQGSMIVCGTHARGFGAVLATARQKHSEYLDAERPCLMSSERASALLLDGTLGCVCRLLPGRLQPLRLAHPGQHGQVSLLHPALLPRAHSSSEARLRRAPRLFLSAGGVRAAAIVGKHAAR